ncbi:MAG: hypothetical protein ACRCTN_11065 [Carnobacterium maltaromaticum]
MIIINIENDLSKSEIRILKYMWHPVLKMNVPFITSESLKSKNKIDSSMVDHCLQTLTSLGYIEVDEFSNNYKITPSGRTFLEKHNSKFKSKVFWSLFVPFITALITSLTTAFVTYNYLIK